MPDGWRSTTLGADAVLVSGQHILAEECTDDSSGCPYITGPADFPNGQIQVSKYVRSAKVLCEQGDILITVKGSGTGRLARADRSYCISRQLCAIRATIWSTPFLFHVLSMEQDRLRSAACGLIPGLSRDDILGLRILVPPVGEQRTIAAVLSSVEDAIEATQAVIDQLQVVKKAMVVELLTRGFPGRHTRFKKTEIGEVPNDWEIARLDSLAVVQTGIAKGKQIEGGIELPYLRVANVQDGFVDLTEMKTIVVDAPSVDRFRLRPGDVLFTEGGDADKLGRGCVWRGQIDPCLHQNHVFSVRPNKERLRPEFLALWAASPRGKAYFLDCAKQTTNLASINSTQLKALPVPVPTIDVQDEVVSAISSTTDRIDAERTYQAQLSAAKSALMSVLLTGEVRVTPDEAAASAP